jgi:protein-tyrosine phosphatase
LWRSADLHSLDDHGRRFIRDLHFQTIFDLRDESERVLRPNALDECDPPQVVLPFSELGWTERWTSEARPPGDWMSDHMLHDQMMLSGYETLPREFGFGVSALVRRAVQPNALPALIHCTAGKDRTGLVVAVLLQALGVGDKDIIRDYAMSANCSTPTGLRSSPRRARIRFHHMRCGRNQRGSDSSQVGCCGVTVELVGRGMGRLTPA